MARARDGCRDLRSRRNFIGQIEVANHDQRWRVDLAKTLKGGWLKRFFVEAVW